MKFSRTQGYLPLKNSTDPHLLQIADITAYNAFRQLREYGDLWDDPHAGSPPLYPYFERILPRLHRSAQGQLAGYGVAKFPLGEPRPTWSAAPT